MVFAEKDANLRLVFFRLQLHVNHFHVEVELARVLRLKISGLELDDNITVQFDIVKEKVDEKIPLSNPEQPLFPDIGKA